MNLHHASSLAGVLLLYGAGAVSRPTWYTATLAVQRLCLWLFFCLSCAALALPPDGFS
jgi:hypothetical protein